MNKALAVLAACLLSFPSFAGGQREKAAIPREPARTFAIVQPILHPFFIETSIGAEEEAAALGVKVINTGPDRFDVQQQIDIVEQLIADRVDGIAIGPTDPIALTPVINQAIETGIQVICLADDAPRSKRLAFIGTDDDSAGRMMGRLVADLLGNRGKILVSMGVPTQYILNVRLKATREVLAQYPQIEVLDIRSGEGNPEKTLANIEAMVQAHPYFDALIGIDAAAGPAAIIVWKAKGLTQPVITYDDTSDILQGIRDGKITISLAQKQYLWGKLAVRRLNELCDGKEIPRIEYTGIVVVTQQNVDTYKSSEAYKSNTSVSR
jgi:ribose transport system substrate-binding protein